MILLGLLYCFGEPVVAAPQDTCKFAVIIHNDNDFGSDIGTYIQPSVCETVDSFLALAAFKSQAFETPFNLTTDEAKSFSSAVGADFSLLVRSDVQKRLSLEKGDTVEAYAALFLVNGRTGKLEYWDIHSAEGSSESDAVRDLLISLKGIGAHIDGIIRRLNEHRKSAQAPTAPEVIDGGSASLDVKPPAPFRQIPPEYTAKASFYGIEATVEANVDIASDGSVSQISIVRWAGFGLDEAVAEAINRMRWRPAERLGKKIESRFLVRYNFKKLSK